VRALAEAFNRMSDEIHAKTVALEASRQRAQKALQDYLEVLGFVAHELKSPVNGALTQLNLIEGGYVGKARKASTGPWRPCAVPSTTGARSRRASPT